MIDLSTNPIPIKPQFSPGVQVARAQELTEIVNYARSLQKALELMQFAIQELQTHVQQLEA